MYSCDASKYHQKISINSVFELKLIEYSKATLYDPAEQVYSLVTNNVILRQWILTDTNTPRHLVSCMMSEIRWLINLYVIMLNYVGLITKNFLTHCLRIILQLSQCGNIILGYPVFTIKMVNKKKFEH
jgi:hypothetical protein